VTSSSTRRMPDLGVDCGKPDDDSLVADKPSLLVDRAASSQGLLAMRLRVFRHPLRVIASEAKQSRSNGKSLDCFVARAPRNDVESFPPTLRVIASEA
jgi:hypothetical protein